MNNPVRVSLAVIACASALVNAGVRADQSAAPLPPGAKVVWDLDKAYREATPTRERICINGLWHWQPGDAKAEQTPAGNWGYFKVPGCWPGITDFFQQYDCQILYPHPSWKATKLADVTTAWYQREITVPAAWAGRRISLATGYVNSYAVVYVDGNRAGDIRFPGGDVDLTSVCRPGTKQVLSMLVTAMPLRAVIMSFSDTNAAKQVKGTVPRRGLCGDVWLVGEPLAARIGDIRIDTSVRNGQITVNARLEELAADAQYTLHAQVADKGGKAVEFTSGPIRAGDLKDGRAVFSEKWKPAKLWDIITPENQYDAAISLLDAQGKVLDTSLPVRFGFREFWIDGRDFYLNGTRIFLSCVPLENGAMGVGAASYEAAKETLLRLKTIGINFVYTHNYGCEPGTHLGFTEILRAADDVGMLVAFSQPHFGQYNWQKPDADQANGYARDAAFYVAAAGSHPSVVFYSMSHNATGYVEALNPDRTDGIQDTRDPNTNPTVKHALQAAAIVNRMDPTRVIYHHESGNLGSMYTTNFYTNFAPIQEMDDWFEHWSTKGVKPNFTCEYMVPCTWDWTMYRGWYNGSREYGSASVPWEYCVAEWSSQFLGDRAYQISEAEKQNLRWEAEQFRAGKLWKRWDYPFEPGSKVFDDQHAILGIYTTSNWRAFRTWEMSANSPWDFGFSWKLRDGVDRSRKNLTTAWENLQRPGYSPDYVGEQFERMDTAHQRSDWLPTADGQALLRNNMPLLAYIGGKPAAFTSKDHNFLPGETVEKQLIVINNSRQTVTADCRWSLGLPQAATGIQTVTIATGQQKRVPLRLTLPTTVTPGKYELSATVSFSKGETQQDTFTINVMPRPESLKAVAKIAVFDPKGETTKLLAGMGIRAQPIEANVDLAGYDIVVVGKGALTVDDPGPDVRRVRDGLKVLMFEQTSETLERRFGFRVAEYGLRQVFKRVPDHALLAGLEQENPARLAGRRDAPTAAPEVLHQPHLRRAGHQVVRPGSAPGLAVRQSRQRGVGADREAGPRQLPADRRWRVQPPVQPIDGIPRGQRRGAVLPDGRDGAHRNRPGGRDARSEPFCVHISLEAGRQSDRGLRRRCRRPTSPRSLRHPCGFLRGRETLA